MHILRATNDRDDARPLVGLCLFGLLLLFALMILVRAPLVYDEPLYLKPVVLLHKYGFSRQFLLEYWEPAGMLHNLLHWILEPITGLRPPAVRLVNPILLVLTIILTAMTLREVGASEPIATSLTIMGVPFTWVIAGMVLTEMPAILLMALSVHLLVVAKKIELEQTPLAVAAALVGGMALGAAFLSRAMVLVILGALPCLFLGREWHSWRIAAPFLLGAVVVAGPFMLIWGGMVSPASIVPVDGGSFSIRHLLLSIAYAAVVMFILAPGWFALGVRVSLGLFGTIFVINALTGFLDVSVARSVVAHLPAALADLVPRLAGSLMLALSVLFVVCSAKNLYARRADPIWAFFSVSMLLLVAAPVKIVHQYSSRYTAMASVMMLLASAPFTTPGKWSTLRVALGMALGLAILMSYLYPAR